LKTSNRVTLPPLLALAQGRRVRPRKAKAPAPKDRNAEARIQAAIVEYVRAVAPGVLIYAIPNGGLRTKAEAARMKWTGTLAGMPDLGLVLPDGRACFVEVKTPKGRLSDIQMETFMLLKSRSGWPPCVILARCIEDVRDALMAWKVETREAGRTALFSERAEVGTP
jgi:hypothetical protein